MIEELIKKRKKLKLSIIQLSRIMGYSKDWLYKVEFGERRVSQKFIQAYEEALDKYENILKKDDKNGR